MADRDAITTPSTDIFNFNQLANQTKHLGGVHIPEVDTRSDNKSESASGWGVEGYSIPVQEALPRKDKGYSVPKSKLTYASQITRSVKDNPGPNQYQAAKPDNWQKEWKAPLGKIFPGKKHNFLDDIKKRKAVEPGPADYGAKIIDPKKEAKSLGARAEKTSFLCDVQYLASTSPEKHLAISERLVTKRVTHVVDMKQQKKKEQGWKVKKDGLEEQKDYDPLKAYKFCHQRTQRAQFLTGKATRFTDIEAKRKKDVPGAGQYDVFKGNEKVYKPMKHY